MEGGGRRADVGFSSVPEQLCNVYVCLIPCFTWQNLPPMPAYTLLCTCLLPTSMASKIHEKKKTGWHCFAHSGGYLSSLPLPPNHPSACLPSIYYTTPPSSFPKTLEKEGRKLDETSSGQWRQEQGLSWWNGETVAGMCLSET